MFYVALSVVFELETKKGLHTHHKASHFLRPLQISHFLQVSSFRQMRTRFSLYSLILERKRSYQKVVTSLTGCIRDEFPLRMWSLLNWKTERV